MSQKDVDDPSMNLNLADNSQNNTSATLSKLFAAGDGTTPHPLSRDVSHQRIASSPKNYSDLSTLSGHLLQRGMMDGRYSDITINAFGNSYKLHRLLLDRVPFFSTAFSGPWRESSATEMNLHPEEIDSNITKAAFELALKRVYGCYLPADEEQEAIGLFAVSSWLDMSNVAESSVDILLRQMQPAKLDSLILLVTNNYYGKAGERILASAKAMLCRDGWEMPYKYWDSIPSEIIREVLSGDAFFVPGEWERWYLVLRLLNRRLRSTAVQEGLVSNRGRYLVARPSLLTFAAVRCEARGSRPAIFSGGRDPTNREDKWIALYTCPEVAPLLQLLDEGIHYVHLRFEQLQCIKQQRDVFGVPVLPEKVISDALWMQMELRQRVVNARDTDMELGFSREDENNDDQSPISEADSIRKGKQPETNAEDRESEEDLWDEPGEGPPRKFWIPTSDSSSVLGGASDASLPSTSTNQSGWSPHMSRLSSSLEPADVQWSSDFTSNPSEGQRLATSGSSADRANPRYSLYPPFRFSAEFPNPRDLKEKKRVYSQTVWYAGSMWNLYIQRVTSKTQQLGIYLHRAKDKEPTDDPLAMPGYGITVDDRIGQLERDILRRGPDRRQQFWRSSTNILGLDGDQDSDSPGPAETIDSAFSNAQKTSPSPDLSLAAGLTLPSPSSGSRTHGVRRSSSHILDSESDDEEIYGGVANIHASHQPISPNHRHRSSSTQKSSSAGLRQFSTPAMPPYTDARPAIKTYFKIYSPSRAGRMLSVYESAPDKFNFSQSWGWKSSQMVLDDGIAGAPLGLGTEGLGLGVSGTGAGMAQTKARDGRLRYMVVIGNV